MRKFTEEELTQEQVVTLMKAALMAAKDGVDVYYIGSLEAEGVTTVKLQTTKKATRRWKRCLQMEK